ncbi:sodium:solute symporter [Ferruginibacter paludis]|uniref:sodium:solute symporter n=1 Tax=Ferruginibacter paludis TaxID=1310417 RepID=UPI0025B2EAED|nr:sodium:solute symporter [Ferruginibacter paludis]MDN3654594.1 sodium:solute symporter [Ferruginibacter paludis]
MAPSTLLYFVIGYFLLLFIVAWYTSRNSNNDSFFIGNRNSNWMLVAFGMIGTSLSGVTFVSVPGSVGNIGKEGLVPNALGYFQVVIGYFLGYLVVAYVLLPLYYKLNLTSIYNYLKQRFGTWAYKTGASFFILSRTVGATARLYLVINVLHVFILSRMHIPFYVSAAVVLIMILLYTFEGGVKTIVYTDTLQTTMMILGLIVCIGYILSHLHLSVGEAVNAMEAKNLTRIFNTDINSKGYFIKQIVGGAFITIAMTGLDQEMMQKNISVKNLKDSQKNMLTFSVILVFVNLLFLLLGGLLYLYAYTQGASFTTTMVDGVPVWGFAYNNLNLTGDNLFPSVALGLLQSMPSYISVIFIIALISALFPSADGALTALTSSFCIDILGIKERTDLNEQQKRRLRLSVHLTMTTLFFICILIFREINSRSIIDKILDLAGYTYGPLLGLFTFGILTRRSLPDNFIIAIIAIISPVLCYLLQTNAPHLLNGYVIGIEILIINGLLTFTGLLIISKK